MSEVALKCSCGAVRGTASDISPQTGTRIVCYCDDCQAFARFLRRESDVLDEFGGTDIFQITPAQLNITDGLEKLSCVRVKPGGIIRWYTSCCKTPIGNTVSAGMPFVGLIHNFMDDRGTRDKNLGPVLFHVQGQFAKGKPPVTKLYPAFPLRFMARFLPKLLLAKLRGKSRPTPFFDSSGTPIVAPNECNNG